MKRRTPRAVTPLVAERLLTRNDGRSVAVRIGKPRKVAPDEWECPYHVSGLGMRRVAVARGIDAVQALILAIESTRIFLEQRIDRLSWPFGEAGDLGFPRLVPSALGISFARRINEMIDREIEQFIEAKKRGSGEA